MSTGAIQCSDLAVLWTETPAVRTKSDCFNADTMDRYLSSNELKGPLLAVPTAGSAIRHNLAGRLFNAAGIKNNKTNNRVVADTRSVAHFDTVEFPGDVGRVHSAVRQTSERGARRCVMSSARSAAFALAAACSALLAVGTALPARAQSALDAAQELAQMLDGANATELSGDNLVSALEGAASAGQPIALWQLGVMYETGAGVEKDPAKAFQYFSRIANENADAPPSSLDADIVAQSFVKIGDYFMHGVPDAGIPEDTSRGHTLLMHAATYFGDADAQYRVGMLYLNPDELGMNPLQGARWLSLAARKGHPGAQARLGELLIKGEGIQAQPVEGLMWLNIAYRGALGTADEGWIHELMNAAMATADPAEAEAAVRAADTLSGQFAQF